METLRKLIFGEVLSRSSRAQLAGWMVMNKTGTHGCALVCQSHG